MAEAKAKIVSLDVLLLCPGCRDCFPVTIREATFDAVRCSNCDWSGKVERLGIGEAAEEARHNLAKMMG